MQNLKTLEKKQENLTSSHTKSLFLLFFFFLHMQHSTRDQVNTYLTEYADLVKKYFASLSTVADHSISEEANSPEQLIKQIITIDDNLQKAVEHSKFEKRKALIDVFTF